MPTTNQPSHPEISYHEIYTGLATEVPTLSGDFRRYINFDNAASTPSFLAVQESVDEYLKYYSSVHRGTGFKSQLSTRIYEDAHDTVLDFMGADPEEHTCVFVKNTTEALNKLARRFPFTQEKDTLITSLMEHHSNDLPWRLAANTVHVKVKPDGSLDEDDFDAKLAQYGDRVALVSITAATNVTGIINPIHRLAEKTHRAGALFAADCAQFAPHRQVNMRPLSDPGHIDFAVISAHKMYAPFGTGALICRKDILSDQNLDQVGGGTVNIVTLDEVLWADLPDIDEAGSPNVVGAVALAVAIKQLQKIGMDAVAAHEAYLTKYALEKLKEVAGIALFGDSDPETAANRLGVIPFNINGISHFLVASILGHEFGIGVRNGCFCAHPYILNLLKLSPTEQQLAQERIAANDKSDMPGLVRVSFGLYNSTAEVDLFVDALHRITLGEYNGAYVQNQESGEYHPTGWSPDWDQHFSLSVHIK